MDNQLKLVNILKNYIEKKKNLKKDFFYFQDKKIAIYNTDKKIIAYSENMNNAEKYKLKNLLNKNYNKQVSIKDSSNGYIIPENFYMNDKGLWNIAIKKDKEGNEIEEHILISDRWLFIISKVYSIYHDICQFEVCSIDPVTRKEKIELCTADTLGKWNNCISFLMNSLAVITDESCKKYLSLYFKFFLIENKKNDKIQSKKTVPYMGWNDNLTKFFPYSDKLHLDYTGDTSKYLKNTVKAFNLSKNINEIEYLEKLKFITKSRDADFIISSFLAAPLLKIIGLRSFTINFHGKTKSLKSLACYFGLSMFGAPEKLKNTGEDTTLSNMEKIALFHNLPVYIDEIKNIDEAINIYCIGNESSRHRLNQTGNIQEKKNWRTIVITSSEFSLYNDNSRGGEVNRMICLPVNCFSQLPLKETELKKFAIKNYKFLEKNYSILGKKYINVIIQQFPLIEKTFDYICENITNDSKSEEYKYMIAAICTANYISRKLFFGIDSLDYSVDLGKYFLNKTENTSDLDEFSKMYNCIVSFYEINKDSFIQEGTQQRNIKLFGEVKNKEVRFIKDSLKNYLIKNGFSWNNYSELVKRGLIQYKNARINGNNAKRIVLNLEKQQDLKTYEEEEREGIKNENKEN